MRDQRSPQLSQANKKLETKKALFKLRGLFVCSVITCCDGHRNSLTDPARPSNRYCMFAEKYTLVPLQADEPISSFGGGNCAKGVCATCFCGRHV
jgi:hypothetical protein